MSKKDYIKEVLITHDEIVAYCETLAQTIEKDYKGQNLTLLCLLKGSVPFIAELSKHFTRDDINYEYLRASSYEGASTESAGEVTISSATYDSLKGQNVIVIEDIIDTGYTLSAVYKYLIDEGVNSVKIATLLDKPERREIEIEPDYIGFSIPNHFVIGFGLDYNEKYRNLKDIVIPHPEKI